MNFRQRSKDEPEINLIPFIDVLLVVLIFLMLTTTYTKFTEMQLRLPVADTDAQRDYPREIVVSIASDGRFMVNKQALKVNTGASLLEALIHATTRPAPGPQDVVLIINADANARHQTVVTAMESAKRAGISQITFATQPSAQ
jgi:biopolymer transport protein ExbD